MKNAIRHAKRDRGFTLVELLVTVTIIGVLAAVVTVGVSGSASNAQTKANQGTFSDYQAAIDAWAASNPSVAPATTVPTSATFTCVGTGGGPGTCDNAAGGGTTFLWYTALGSATSSVYSAVTTSPAFNATRTYVSVDPASTSLGFNTFFRLNAGTSTVCVVDSIARQTVLACHN